MWDIIRNVAIALLVVGTLFGLGRAWYWLSGAGGSDVGLAGPAQVLTLPADVSGIGGFSGLIMDMDGSHLRAASDQGAFLDARIRRGSDGRAIAFEADQITAVLSRKGGPLEPFHADLEGLTPLPDGAMGLAYESYTRLLYMPPADAQGVQIPKALHGWQMFEDHFGNTAFEAIATLPSGDMLAILERKPRPAIAHAYLYTKDAWRGPYVLPAQPGWSVSGADVGPDGCLYLLERRYGVLRGFETQMVRMRGAAVLPFDMTREQVWRSAPLRFGNGEGLSLWRAPDAGIIASIITDDGSPPAPFAQPTRFIELPLQAVPDCWDQ